MVSVCRVWHMGKDGGQVELLEWEKRKRTHSAFLSLHVKAIIVPSEASEPNAKQEQRG